jgi:hypothetical protein
MARADHARAGLNVRRGIYTRKSSDEGLDQEFNSLDAQREACEAYIVSQRHAGWIALANMYHSPARRARRYRSWMLLRTSPIRCLSDSIVTDGSEMIRCEGRQDFSMSMID